MGEIEIDGLVIEWDDNKAAINKRKHGISFKMAARIFLDDNRIEDFDDEHSDDEERIKVLGIVEKVLVVIYTERREKLRLISARYANKDEEDEYYGQYPHL